MPVAAVAAETEAEVATVHATADVREIADGTSNSSWWACAVFMAAAMPMVAVIMASAMLSHLSLHWLILGFAMVLLLAAVSDVLANYFPQALKRWPDPSFRAYSEELEKRNFKPLDLTETLSEEDLKAFAKALSACTAEIQERGKRRRNRLAQKKRCTSRINEYLVRSIPFYAKLERLTEQQHTDLVLLVLFTDNGERFFTADTAGVVKRWHINTGECERTYKGHKESVWGMALSTGYLCTSGKDKTIRIWNSDTAEQLLVFEAPSMVTAIALDTEMTFVCASLWSGQHFKYALPKLLKNSGRRVLTEVDTASTPNVNGPPHLDVLLQFNIDCRDGDKGIFKNQLTKDNAFLFAGNFYGEVYDNKSWLHKFDVVTGESCIAWPSGTFGFSLDQHEQFLFTGGPGLEITMYRTNSTDPVQRFSGHQAPARNGHMTLCAEDPAMLSCSLSGDVWQWTMEGKHVGTYAGHEQKVSDIALHPTNPTEFITVSEDMTAKLWDVASISAGSSRTMAHSVKKTNADDLGVQFCISPKRTYGNIPGFQISAKIYEVVILFGQLCGFAFSNRFKWHKSVDSVKVPMKLLQFDLLDVDLGIDDSDRVQMQRVLTAVATCGVLLGTMLFVSDVHGRLVGLVAELQQVGGAHAARVTTIMMYRDPEEGESAIIRNFAHTRWSAPGKTAEVMRKFTQAYLGAIVTFLAIPLCNQLLRVFDCAATTVQLSSSSSSFSGTTPSDELVWLASVNSTLSDARSYTIICYEAEHARIVSVTMLAMVALVLLVLRLAPVGGDVAQLQPIRVESNNLLNKLKVRFLRSWAAENSPAMGVFTPNPQSGWQFQLISAIAKMVLPIAEKVIPESYSMGTSCHVFIVCVVYFIGGSLYPPFLDAEMNAFLLAFRAMILWAAFLSLMVAWIDDPRNPTPAIGLYVGWAIIIVARNFTTSVKIAVYRHDNDM